MICCVLYASIVIDQVVNADSRNQLDLCGQLCIADSKDKGNAMKAYLPEKKTVLAFKSLVLEHVWTPSLVHPCVINLCLPLMLGM